jgi:hypothetical protein
MAHTTRPPKTKKQTVPALEPTPADVAAKVAAKSLVARTILDGDRRKDERIKQEIHRVVTGRFLSDLQKIQKALWDGMTELIDRKPPNVEEAKWSLNIADKHLQELITQASRPSRE